MRLSFDRPDGRARRSPFVAVAVLLVASLLVLIFDDGGRSSVRTGSLASSFPQPTLPPTTTTSTTATTVLVVPDPPLPPPTTPPPPPPPPSTVAPPAPRPTAAPRPARAAAPPATFRAPPAGPAVAGLEAYRGLGTWVDVFDWSRKYANNNPPVGVADIDRMADVGVQTLYIQASKYDSPTDVLEPDLLLPMIERAHQRGISVIGWYLPTLVDPAADLRRLLAIAELPVDGIAVDIEARNVSDVDERNRRLVKLSADLRNALPGRTIGGIVLPPVVLEVVNPAYWPNFPYRELAGLYDVWQTMGYWSNRKADSGYRDPYRYTRENVERLRTNLGLPDAFVHPIGGLAADTSPGDIDAYLRAAVDTRSIGGSLYDWRTTRAETWPNQQGFRR